MTSPRVLILGGTGLISSGIVKALLARQAHVSVYNRGKTEDRLAALPAAADRLTFLHGDRNDESAFEKTFTAPNAPQFDAVIDMICFNPKQAQSDLRAFAGRTRHFLFCSTVCTYGNTQTVIPTTENTPQSPVSDYGRNKLACERLFLDAYHANQFAGGGLTIFRPSHTYGPGTSMINNLGGDPCFIDRLRKGKPILVSGDGHGLWQSAYTDDVGIGFAGAIGKNATFGEAYNIVGNPQDWFTWDQYTQRIARAIGAPEPRLVHVPTDVLLALRPHQYGGLADIFRYHGVYANAKLRRDVPEFNPSTSLEEGVRKTVAWMDARHLIQNSDLDSTDDQIAEAMAQMVAGLKTRLPKTQG